MEAVRTAAGSGLTPVRHVMIRVQAGSCTIHTPQKEISLCAGETVLLELGSDCRVEASAYQEEKEGTLERILAYMDSHCCDLSLEGVAAQFNYHPNTVAQMIRRGTGQSFKELKRQMRLHRAARMMDSEHVSAQQAAIACGYSNMSNFYTQFERCYGMKPGEYAKTKGIK